MLTDLVFNLGKQYALLGGNIDDALASTVNFADAIGKARLAPELAHSFTQLGLQEQATAGGLQGRFMTAAFIDRMWNKIPQLQEGLNNASTKMGFAGGWKTMPFMKKTELLGQTGDYLLYKRAQFEFLKDIASTRGEPVATAIAKDITGMEYKQLDTIFTKLDSNLIDREKGATELRNLEKTDQDRFKDALADFTSQTKSIALQQQEFYSELMGTLKTLQGGFMDAADAMIYGEKGFRMTTENAQNIQTRLGEKIREKELITGRALTQAEIQEMVSNREKAALITLDMLKKTELESYRFDPETHQRIGRKGVVPLGEYIPPESLTLPGGKASYTIQMTLIEATEHPATTGKPSTGTQNTPGQSLYKLD